MLGYIEYLKLPTTIALILVGIFAVIQVIGEVLEFKGKVVPEFVKIRKYFARRKREREILHQLPEKLDGIHKVIMEEVNAKLREDDAVIKELNRKLDQNNEQTLSLIIDSKRNTIINFASFVIDDKNPVTREQFNRVFKLYEEYERIIKENKLTNGEIDIAIKIIRESYEKHLRERTFVEDIKGYK